MTIARDTTDEEAPSYGISTNNKFAFMGIDDEVDDPSVVYAVIEEKKAEMKAELKKKKLEPKKKKEEKEPEKKGELKFYLECYLCSYDFEISEVSIRSLSMQRADEWSLEASKF